MKYNKNTKLFDISKSQGKQISYGDILLIYIGGNKELASVTQITSEKGKTEYQLIVIPDFNRWNGNNIKEMLETEVVKEINAPSRARLLTREEKQEFKNLLKDFTNSLSINGK